jgi:glycosyltransferase involved in cell wall biosynthesis
VNLLLVIHYPVFGGPHNQALRLARALEREGVNVTVLLPEHGEGARRLRAAGIDVITTPLHRARATLRLRPLLALVWHLPGEIKVIRSVIRERAIDVVQLEGLVNPHAAIAATLERTAVVWQLLDTRAPMIVRRLLMPLVVRLSDVVMSTGRAVAHVHPGAEALGRRLHPFFPPVDIDEFSPGKIDGDGARRSYGFREEDIVLVSVGNLNPQKGHEYLLRAVGLLRRDGHRAKALVVGASHETHVEYERELYRLCRRLGLGVGRDVVFAGALDDVRPALAAADIFVLSSVPRSEGIPTAAEEAMMMHLPVVATDVGAVSELIEHGVSGLLVRPLDARALADAILHVVDPDTRTEMGARAHERAVMLCSTEQCAQLHVQAYDLAVRHRDARVNGGRRRARTWRKGVAPREGDL